MRSVGKKRTSRSLGHVLVGLFNYILPWYTIPKTNVLLTLYFETNSSPSLSSKQPPVSRSRPRTPIATCPPSHQVPLQLFSSIAFLWTISFSTAVELK
ncbi:hypothetical protein K435DRAFT_418826 [Dendrothele bispora CBS 962.96]|uniref:Uncharacterized protein n=1 Tax=Dendrothele bispora (strain CBS 962.96) TaxID=1314807 RepID=A0A4V4HH20_DENBC|nr:hypothetical protein K435DRAFT_418826 [Dendrothele bispora CBS 962.96]